MVIDKYKTGFAPTLDVPFEDLSNPISKNSNSGSNTKLTMSSKPKKRAGLLGIFGGGQKVCCCGCCLSLFIRMTYRIS